jgi:hypothetical protein
VRLSILFLLLVSSVCSAKAEFEAIPSFMYEEQYRHDKLENLIELNSVEYLRNSKASFCTRPTDMIDTIVLHHSETRNTETPEDINRYHLNRGSSSDPWYMIAYSFVMMSPYAGETIPAQKAYYGRPINIVGAHAGSNIFVPMDAVQKKLWAQKKILCGKENTTPEYDPTLVKNGKIKANVTTIGVVVNGNYSLFSGPRLRNGRRNPYPNPNGFIPAKQPTESLIDSLARLSCQLQKSYPRVKTIAFHNQYHRTSCPGSIQETKNLKAIQAKAKEYGCEFKLLSPNYY